MIIRIVVAILLISAVYFLGLRTLYIKVLSFFSIKKLLETILTFKKLQLLFIIW